MNDIKVSIIIPVYNVEKYLNQCLNSIIEQTLKEIEIICVNDGSTDNSLLILENYKKIDSRIKIITKVNDGLGAARNTGIEAACGEYIGFVDSDDFVDKTMFEKLYYKGIITKADVVISNLDLYYDDTGKRKIYRDVELYHELEKLGGFKAEKYSKIVRNIAVWDRIYRLEFLKQKKLKNPEHVIYEDALFTYQTTILADKIAVVNEPLYQYRKNTGVAITDKEIKNDKYKFDYLSNNRSIKQFLIDNNVYKIYYVDFWVYHLTGAIWHHSNVRNYKTFKKFFLEIKNMMDDDVYDFIKCQSNRALVEYATKIKDCNLILFYLTFAFKNKIKRLLYRIYGRLFTYK